MPKEKTCTECGIVFIKGGGRGYCPKHYMQVLRTGSPTSREWNRGGKPCSTDPAHGKAHGLGLCQSCLSRKMRQEKAFGQCRHGECPNDANGGELQYCSTHQYRHRNNLEMDAPIRSWVRRTSQCSVEACSNPAAPGGYCKTHDREDYGTGWAKSRDIVRKRDGYACQNCGSLPPENATRAWPVAHLIPVRAFPKDLWADLAHDPCNLIVLCIACHVSFDRAVDTVWRYEVGEHYGRKMWPSFASMPTHDRVAYHEKLWALSAGRIDMVPVREFLLRVSEELPRRDARVVLEGMVE